VTTTGSCDYDKTGEGISWPTSATIAFELDYYGG